MSARVCRACGPYYATLHNCPMTASQSLPLAELSPAELAAIQRFGIFEAEETVEKVARALWLADNPALAMFSRDELDELWAHNRNDRYRRLAAAAIAAMPVSPAEEACVCGHHWDQHEQESLMGGSCYPSDNNSCPCPSYRPAAIAAPQTGQHTTDEEGRA